MPQGDTWRALLGSGSRWYLFWIKTKGYWCQRIFLPRERGTEQGFQTHKGQAAFSCFQWTLLKSDCKKSSTEYLHQLCEIDLAHTRKHTHTRLMFLKLLRGSYRFPLSIHHHFHLGGKRWDRFQFRKMLFGDLVLGYRHSRDLERSKVRWNREKGLSFSEF